MFRLLVNSTLLFTIPSIALYPQGNAEKVSIQKQKATQEDRQAQGINIPSYEEIMRLLEGIESGELEKRCSAEELNRITHYIAFLAQEGVLPDGSEESLSLGDDIEGLINEEKSPYAYTFYSGFPNDYMIAPAIFYGHEDVVLCKSWAQKQWKHTTKFCKKHKKAIIIGATVVVAVAAVVVAVAVIVPALTAGAVDTIAASAAGAVGAASASATSGSDKTEEKNPEKESFFISRDPPPPMAVVEDAPILKSAIDNQISSFKENIVQQQFFHQVEFRDHPQELSFKENGRILGSLFAHDSLNALQNQTSNNPRLAQEIEEMKLKYSFVVPGWNNNSTGHSEIDRRFSTDYTHLYANSGGEVDFNTLSYQVRGERALAYGYLTQAVQDLDKAIELGPINLIPYLDRGIAYFGLGQYDHSLEDYKEFTSQVQKTYPLVVTDFSLGFAKGLPKGIYDSGEGIFLLISDLVRHPIHTGGQMFEALSLLANLAVTEQWDALSEVLAPEVRQLIKEWDTISSDKRGELAGYAFGKYGSDIVIPGALTKVMAKGVKGAQELSYLYKSLQTAEKTLLLESVAGLESGSIFISLAGRYPR